MVLVSFLSFFFIVVVVFMLFLVYLLSFKQIILNSQLLPCVNIFEITNERNKEGFKLFCQVISMFFGAVFMLNDMAIHAVISYFSKITVAIHEIGYFQV